MAYLSPYRIAETSTSTGTGSFTLSGTITGYATFASQLATNDTATIVIEAIDANGQPTGDWEICDTVFTSPDTVTRGTLRGSSTGSRITFGAGTKRVFIIALGGAALQATSPALPYPGELWVDTDNNRLGFYDGSVWSTVVANLENWTEGVDVTNLRPIVYFQATNAATDVDAAIVPKGNGALTAAIADGTTVGGDARGPYSVDWQTYRVNSTEVASGDSAVISGGTYNTASNSWATVSGGASNIASGSSSTVGGGDSNTASGSNSVVSGGSNNTASNDSAAVSGGYTNTASGLYSAVSSGRNNTVSTSYSVISGGRNNAVSGDYSVISGGIGNTASGYQATVGGGANNTASGYLAVISGGYTNTASGDYSFIGGAYSSTASGYVSCIVIAESSTASAQYATIVGGYGHSGAGDYSFIGGGYTHTASGNYSFIGGGESNTASASYATVGGGYSNDASAQYAAIAGGNNNTASGQESAVAGGNTNVASGLQAFVGGGYNNAASGDYAVVAGGTNNTASGNFAFSYGNDNVASGAFSVVGGNGATTRGLSGADAFTSGRFASLGDSQRVVYVARVQTTTATPAVMTFDGSAAGTTNQVVLPDNATYFFKVSLVARRTDATNESAAYTFEGCIDRNTGAASTALVGTPVKTILAEDTTAWDAAVSADTTNGALAITVTGQTSKTIRWVAKIETVEVTA